MKYESTLKAVLLRDAPIVIPNMRLFVRNTGEAKMPSGNYVQFSVPGQCDLCGYLKGGQAIEIELKSATGTLRPDQRVWRDWCLGWGVPWILLKGKEDETAEQTVSRWFGELKTMIG